MRPLALQRLARVVGARGASGPTKERALGSILNGPTSWPNGIIEYATSQAFAAALGHLYDTFFGVAMWQGDIALA
jgi:hypothetical protein